MLDETNRRAAVDLSIRTGSGTVYWMRAGNWLGNLDPQDPQQKFNDFNKGMIQKGFSG